MSMARLLADRVPRYTSYPTAPHFHVGVDGATVRGWLEQLPPGSPLSLYLHIPFCDTLCWFCGCHTRVVNTYSPVAGYLSLLQSEIDRVAAAVGRSHPVTHIHFGGGSPTMLTPKDFALLCEHLDLSFTIDREAEIAVEIDPRSLSDALIETMAACGVNRASIGVQDCDARVQRAINRIQPFATTKQVVERLHAAGIDRLNIDLIYGLPYQTVALLEGTIARTVALDPDRLAVFGYAHVPHFKKHQSLIDAAALPDLEERLDQFNAAHALLSELGYSAIGLDHFARPGDAMAEAGRAGKLARNFQGYTTDSAPALIGLGASAISSLPQGYAQNLTEVPAYREAIAAGRSAIARGIALSDDDRLRRAIIERLMCDLEVDVAQMALRAGAATSFESELSRLEPFVREGLAHIEGTKISIPSEARVAVRSVCAVFDRYLAPSEGRHALAV